MSAPSPTGERIAVVHGHSLPPGIPALEGRRVEVDAGGERPLVAIEAGEVVALPRHGLEHQRPAHLIDHHANIRALCELGCDRVVALASTGSLRVDWRPGTLVCPDDFLAIGVAPSFYADVRGHSVPGFDQAWRARLVRAWAAAPGELPLVDGGVYAQTSGPRFETPAEVRVLARDADLVGMTVASEAILAREAGLAYAAVCTVDNLANGLEEKPLSVEEYREARNAFAPTLIGALGEVLPRLIAPEERADG
jgi:5'-methylthioadenosine phosphorylase